MVTTENRDYLSNLDKVCADVISPSAHEVDIESAFPQGSVAALGAAGFLGAISNSDLGGWGFGLAEAASIVQRIAQECGSTAMVLCMHYCGAAVIEATGSESFRREVAAGKHLSTLAFSEAGSRSHFWSPAGTAESNGSAVTLDAQKSWVTAASHATAYVWSSRPVAAEGMSTIWLVPRETAGISIKGGFDGLGLRGNESSPVTADGAKVPASAMLGEDGKGFDIMMQTVLPLFNTLSAAISIGFMEAALRRTVEHAAATRHGDTGLSLAELPTIRAYVARMQVKTDMVKSHLQSTLAAISNKAPDTLLRVLECKAAAGETATEVLDLAMRICGGAAFRKDVGIERYFRDARAAGVMAPTTDVLYDFIGKAICGLPVF